MSDSDKWEPLQIENYEEVAQAGEQVAKALHDENGYRSEYGNEADYTISEIRNFSKNLKDDNGQTFKIKIQEILKLSENVQKITENINRITKALTPFIKLIKFILGNSN